MNICFLSFDYPSAMSGGGVGNQVRILGRALVRAGHQVTVVALAHPGLPALQEDEGVQVHRVQPGGLHWYASKIPGVGALVTLPLRELEYAWAGYQMVRQLHKQRPFDIIEGTETGALGVALRLPNVPLIVRLHGERYTFHKYTPGLSLTPGLRLSRELQRMAIRRARVLISPSRSHAQEIREEFREKHPPIEVIPNCIDLTRLPAKDNTKRDPTMVLYVGRLERVKGVLLLLEAAGRVIQQMPNARFVLAGASHPTVSRAEIDALIIRYGLEENVQILGHVPWEQLLLWYRKAILCVLPSYYETFGIAAVEPMALGCPVVVASAGALSELVEDGVTGLIVPVGDATRLAQVLLRLLGDNPLRLRLADTGAERVRSHWSIDRLGAMNLQLYLQVAHQ